MEVTSAAGDAGEASARTMSPTQASRVAVTFKNETRTRTGLLPRSAQPELNALVAVCHPPPCPSRVDSTRTQSDRRFSPGASTTNREPNHTLLFPRTHPPLHPSGPAETPAPLLPPAFSSL